MLKRHRNAFLDAIRESGLDPALFSAEQRDYKFTVEIKNTPLKFVVEETSINFDVFWSRATKFAPGYPLDRRWSFFTAPVPAETVLGRFRKWLDEVAKMYVQEMDLPDYWSQIEMYKSVMDDSTVPSGDNREQFSEEEKQEVRNSINKFRKMINEEFNPTHEQEQFITERLDYLARAADRLNRFDWNGLAISIVVSIAVNLSVDTERGRVLFTLFKTAFQATTKLLQ
jgi:hypothetical protein